MHSPDRFPRTQVIVLGLMFIIFAAAFGVSFTFAPLTDIYPRAIAAIGAALALLELALFSYQYYTLRGKPRKAAPATQIELNSLLADFLAVAPYMLWLLFYFLLIYLIGLIIASGIFAFLFLFIVGRVTHWKALAAGLAAAAMAFLIVDILNLARPEAVYDPFTIYRRFLRLPF